MSDLVKRSAVARWLEKSHEDVSAMIELDGLPVTRVPGRKRLGVRVYLPDLHEWMLPRMAEGSRLRDYEEFSRSFAAAQKPQCVES